MFNKRNSLSLMLALAVMPAIALANTTNNQAPPNTMDLQLGSSPVISQLPMEHQAYVVPSLQSSMQNEVDNYIASQPTPSQIQTIKQNELNIARMTASPYVEIPKPVVRSMAVNLAPGEQPPLVRLAKGMLTSIVVTDNNGVAWPIEKVVINQQQITDHTSAQEDGNTNIITLEPNETITWSNISVTLKDKAVPVMFILASGQPEVDLRVDAKVPGVSPNAKKAGEYVGDISMHGAVSEIDNAALYFLDGVIPATAERLTSSSADAQGWLLNGSLYVKTRYDILYPRYHSKASSGTGVHVYRLDNAISPVGVGRVTFTQKAGQPVSVSFEKAPNLYYNQ